MSDYIGTFSGKKVWLPDPDPESFDIEDIARALSHAARFAGHTFEHWSVAQHSLCCAELVRPQHALQALLHDATEAYLCDMPTPFKNLMPEYKNLEARLWEAISTRFDIPYELHSSVKEADRIMLMTERDYFRSNGEDWGEEYESTIRVPSLIDKYVMHSAHRVRSDFLYDFEKYGGKQ